MPTLLIKYSYFTLAPAHSQVQAFSGRSSSSGYLIASFLLILQIWNRQRYKLPSCLFSFEDIIGLRLHNCILKSPSTFEGFKSLFLNNFFFFLNNEGFKSLNKRLDIERVTLSQHVFEDFIVRCPMLEGLILKNCT